MIPAFNHSHVLPPFAGGDPTSAALMPPYETSMLALAQQFAHLPGRRALIEGLLNYRAALATHGFTQGFQWLDGSFAEDVEAAQQRPPNDIDMVTFAFSPAGKTSAEIAAVLNAHPFLFQALQAKQNFGCDGYIVPLDKSPAGLVRNTAYYFSLFSHRRGDHVWKGMLHVPLVSDDAQARILIENLATGGSHADAA